MENSQIGKIGEEFVCRYLERNGYTIIKRNYRIKGGEIDIIASDGVYLAFVEVKTRKPDGLTNGFDAVTKRKQRLIVRAACDYCVKNKLDLQPRFDVARVIFDGVKYYKIDYVRNAFDTTGMPFIF
jgi:putative endonuclease